MAFWGHLSNNSGWYEQFIIHLGPALKTLRLPSLCDLRAISHLLCTYSTHLRSIRIFADYDGPEPYDGAYECIQSLISAHQSLRNLTLGYMKQVPTPLLQLALTKLRSITLQSCTIMEDETTISCAVHRDVSFICVNTPMPPSLCALVTDLCINGRELTQLATTRKTYLCELLSGHLLTNK